MPRTARHKSQEATFYHLINRVAGNPRYFPFNKAAVASRFMSVFDFYLDLYFCRLAAFQLMGNHYHAVVHFEAFRQLGHEELRHRAKKRFGRLWKQQTRHWTQSRWEQFNRDLFDVSKFMQHVNGEFSKWFNPRYGRRGHFWANRFKNPELLSAEAVQQAILYVELNSVRAGLVKRPEHDRNGSAYWRWAGKKAHRLIGLEELFQSERGRDSFTTYREGLYLAGAVTSKRSQGVIAEPVPRREEERSFVRPGLFCRRLRFFSDGVAIGRRDQVSVLIEVYRQAGIYKRRRNPVPQLGGRLFTLREQRSHAYSPG